MTDLNETLAQLDRRLADVRQQVAGLAAGSDPPPPPAPPPPRRSLPVPNTDPEPETADETAPPAGQATDEPDPPGPQAPDRVGQETEGDAAHSFRVERLAPPPDPTAPDRIGQLGAQIEQLLTVRDRLLDDARDLVRSYERQLEEIEREETSGLQAASSLLWEPPAELDMEAGRPAFFDGLVTVAVAGVDRIQTIEVLEDSLSRIHHVQDVYVRRWQAGTVWFELGLTGGVELLGELNRVLPFAFGVQWANRLHVLLALEEEG